MRCPSCGAENPAGSKYCGACAALLSRTCPACQSVAAPGQTFCRECGALLDVSPTATVLSGGRAPTQDAVAELRHVSVLFADLVGFTPLAEGRDAEAVRELLSRYFDACRGLIDRYGGTIEKFIGDAVMAVWGTPVAQEDDAERAVRAALDLVELVPSLVPGTDGVELRARAAVVTGEAAVTIGAEHYGMVAGDLVNTASRVQSAAEPGRVLVGEATRRASDAAIVYADAGELDLKGKAEPVRVWRALRVIGGRKGAQRAQGLEAPFVGRERELRSVKELFHACAEDQRAHLLSIIGVAGIGKSRLAWEFEKYMDGVAADVWWHRGRCLAYGEGVTYWALAEMIRMRAGIVEGEEPEPARAKLRASVAEHILDSDDRSWIEPRLAQLLGLEDREAREPEDLFSAWRRFFERLADRNPVVLVFEDLQWADASLLAFIEYLLDWSRNHSIYVLTLARPELSEHHPNWGPGRRNFTSLYLEPLADSAMAALLAGLVPGLPEELRDRILERAEGVPLYAVETVRMLLDRGLLAGDGSAYRVVGPVTELEVPETLHALIAARLDSLPVEERRLLQDAAVLGKTFTTAALAALGDVTEEKVAAELGSLVRKEVISLQQDPRSPERGQYAFLQDLVRRVAYETVSKRERRARHLAAAAWLASSWGGDPDEIGVVLASHYLEACRLEPESADAERLRAGAGDLLARAGERAASMAATADAQRLFEQAAELAAQPSVRAQLCERAGQMASVGNRLDEAVAHLELALELFEAQGAVHAAARVAARLGNVDWYRGREELALTRMEQAFAALGDAPMDGDFAELAARLGFFYLLKGDMATAGARIESALTAAEALELPAVISEALVTKKAILLAHGRYVEGLALAKEALDVALRHDLSSYFPSRALASIAEALRQLDRYAEALDYDRQGLALARKTGFRWWELNHLSEMTWTLLMQGEWDEALDRIQGLTEHSDPGSSHLQVLLELAIARGDLAGAQDVQSRVTALETSPDLQNRGLHGVCLAEVLAAQGRHAEALEMSERSFVAVRGLGLNTQYSKALLVQSMESASQLGDLQRVEELINLLESTPRGSVGPFLRGQAARYRARLYSAHLGDSNVEPTFQQAGAVFREVHAVFWLAVVLLEHGEWLVSAGRRQEAAALLEEAGATFERLRATPWLERLRIASSSAGELALA
jgi:class 3 adenylate cyclase/tetratricopeptide (TPR) repeat protein